MYVLFNNGEDDRQAEERRKESNKHSQKANGIRERKIKCILHKLTYNFVCRVCILWIHTRINNVPLKPPKSKVDLSTCPNENCMTTLQTEEESPWHSPHDQRKIAPLDKRHWKADSTKGSRPQHVLRTKLPDAGLPRATWHPGTPQPPQPYATGPKSIHCIMVKFILWKIKVFFYLN